jgi:hypothetical protein
MTERSSQYLDSSPVRSESRRRGLRWTTAEAQIRALHVDALDELDEAESRRLYALELAAARHAGESPRSLVQRAEQLLS